MTLSRREWLLSSTALASTTLASFSCSPTLIPAQEKEPTPRNRFAVSTYSFWQFRHEPLRDVEKCFELAADMGFDGVEILHRQMQNEENGYLQRLKKKSVYTRS